MVRRTRDEAAETRSSILDAAERVFDQRGVSHTSLEDIARAAGVTRGAIYWHFRNKSEVFTAMVDRIRLPMEEMVGRSTETEALDPLALLRDAALCTLKRTATDAQCQRVMGVVTHKCEYLEEMSGVKDRVSQVKCNCVDRAEQAIRNAIGRGLVAKTVDARLAAVGLDALICGLISNWLADRSYIDLERDAEPVIDRYLASLRLDLPKPARAARKRARKAVTA